MDGGIILIAKPGNRLIHRNINVAIFDYSIINMDAYNCSHYHH